ncbi:MAG: hypothetical protein ACR2MM_11515 [Flavobacteriaceae bacterium]
MKKNILLMGFLLLFLSSCKTTYLQYSTNVSDVKKSYEKILIVSRSKDKTVRIKAEQQIVRELAARGVKAESSIEMIKTESFDKELSEKDLDELRKQLINMGYKAIVVNNLVDAQEYTDVIPGNTSTAYMPVRYGRFGRYYSYYPTRYWEPDRVETGMEYTLESCLYDLTITQGDNLQWVGQFKVKNPSDLMTVLEKFSSELTDELLVQSINP